MHCHKLLACTSWCAFKTVVGEIELFSPDGLISYMSPSGVGSQFGYCQNSHEWSAHSCINFTVNTTYEVQQHCWLLSLTLSLACVLWHQKHDWYGVHQRNCKISWLGDQASLQYATFVAVGLASLFLVELLLSMLMTIFNPEFFWHVLLIVLVIIVRIW